MWWDKRDDDLISIWNVGQDAVTLRYSKAGESARVRFRSYQPVPDPPGIELACGVFVGNGPDSYRIVLKTSPGPDVGVGLVWRVHIAGLRSSCRGGTSSSSGSGRPASRR